MLERIITWGRGDLGGKTRHLDIGALKSRLGPEFVVRAPELSDWAVPTLWPTRYDRGRQ